MKNSYLSGLHLDTSASSLHPYGSNSFFGCRVYAENSFLTPSYLYKACPKMGYSHQASFFHTIGFEKASERMGPGHLNPHKLSHTIGFEKASERMGPARKAPAHEGPGSSTPKTSTKKKPAPTGAGSSNTTWPQSQTILICSSPRSWQARRRCWNHRRVPRS